MLKRFKWLTDLILATAVLWISAGMVTSIIGYVLYDPPKPVNTSVKIKPVKQRSIAYYDIIKERDLFNVDKKPVASSTKENAKIEAQKIADMGVVLKGTIAGPEEIARAIIEEGGKQKIYRIGDRIKGADILAIYRNEVILDVNGQKQKLVIKETQSSGVISARQPSSSGVAAGMAALPNTAMGNIMQNLDKYIGRARISPYFKGGEPYGFRISNVNRGSMIYDLGVRSGDVLKSVNGIQIKTPEEAFKAYQELQSETSVSVELERRGATQTIDVPLDELLSNQ